MSLIERLRYIDFALRVLATGTFDLRKTYFNRVCLNSMAKGRAQHTSRSQLIPSLKIVVM